MSIFSKKEKVNLSEFCSSYYHDFLLSPSIGDQDVSETYNELISSKIVEVDSKFQSVKQSDFSHEVLLIRFELFALAWFHKFGIETGILNSVFTKQYLESNSLAKIWEEGMPYNHAVSSSATYGYDSSTVLGRIKLLDVNKTKVDQFGKYIEKGFEGNCIARVLNRYGTEANWKRMFITHNFLIQNLGTKIGHDFNEQSTFILVATLKGFYEGSSETLKTIKIVS